LPIEKSLPVPPTQKHNEQNDFFMKTKKRRPMTIEFNIPHNGVQEHLIQFIQHKLLDFHHRDKDLSRAKVNLRRQPDTADREYVCEITLTMSGDSIMAHRNAADYTQAARDALNTLSEKVDEMVKDLKSPPDTITSTVKV
jgi:ribosome-associated translation inhibitor RaiA